MYGINGLKAGVLSCGQQLCTLFLLAFSLFYSSGGGIRVLCLFLTGLLGESPGEAGVQAAGEIHKRGEQAYKPPPTATW